MIAQVEQLVKDADRHLLGSRLSLVLGSMDHTTVANLEWRAYEEADIARAGGRWSDVFVCEQLALRVREALRKRRSAW